MGGGEGAEQSRVTLLDAMRCALLPVPLPPQAGAVAWAEAACGEAHSAATTTDGTVFTWG